MAEDPTSNDNLDDFLTHYGVKGMRWGVRKDRGGSGSSSRSKKSSSKDDSDDSDAPKKTKKQSDLSKYSDDKLNSKLSELKGPDALSDAELGRLTKRMQLEQSYRELLAKRPQEKSKVDKFLDGAKLLGETAENVTTFLNTPVGKKLTSKVVGKK